MGFFKQRDISLQSIKIGTIGVILDDDSRPAKLWEVMTIWGDGELTLIKPGVYIDCPRVTHCYPEEFWPLVDTISPFA